MIINKDLKIGIFSSILGAIIFLFLQPLLSLLWKLIKDISLYSYSGFIDGIYKRAAYGQTDELLFVILYILLVNGAAVACILFLKFKRTHSEFARFNNVDVPTISKTSPEKIIKVGRYLINFGYFFLPITFIILLLTLLKLFAVVELNTSFNQRLNVVLPYINSQTERQLKSEWALMNTSKDFDKIDFEIVSIGRKAKIRLPDNLLK